MQGTVIRRFSDSYRLLEIMVTDLHCQLIWCFVTNTYSNQLWHSNIVSHIFPFNGRLLSLPHILTFSKIYYDETISFAMRLIIRKKQHYDDLNVHTF